MVFGEIFDFERLYFQAELLLRLFGACLLGGVVGFERKNRNKGAGIRTHAIVALGSALIMIVSKYGFGDMGSHDGARLAAQVVSGIGFIGAGIIFVRNNAISGLTTAAGIWATSGIGLAIGAGLYFIAVSSAVMIVLVQIVMHKKTFLTKEPYRTYIRLIVRPGDGSIDKIQKILTGEKIIVLTMKINKSERERLKIEFEGIFPAGYDKSQFVSYICEQDFIISAKC